MIDIDITTDNQTGLAGLIGGLTTQLPFAYSLGLNKLVTGAQQAIQRTLDERFTLRRREFVERTIYRKPGADFATRSKLEASVRVNPERNQLAKFELGGEKRSRSGKDVAVPVFREHDRMRVIRPGDPLSVPMLMAAIKRSGGKVLHPRLHKGQLRVRVDPNRVFLVTNEEGTFILQRLGPGDRNNRVLYWFRKSVPIPADLHFDETAMATVLANADATFADALAYAMETAR